MQAPAADSLWQWLREAEGVFFWPQAALVAATLVTLVFCWDTLRAGFVSPKAALTALGSFINNGARDDFERQVRALDAPLAELFAALIAESKRSAAARQWEQTLDNACEDIDVSIERRLHWLSTLAHVAMLVGLLGTVWGLTASFHVVARTNTAPPPNELAAGVSQALTTTIVGLLSAIPALLSFGHLQGLAARRSADCRRHGAAALGRLRELA